MKNDVSDSTEMIDALPSSVRKTNMRKKCATALAAISLEGYGIPDEGR